MKLPHRGITLIVAGMLLAPPALLAPLAAAQDATPAAECAATTPEQNKEIVARFLAATASGNPEDFAGLMADDHQYHGLHASTPDSASGAGGAAGASEWLDKWDDEIDDLKAEIIQSVAEGDTVMTMTEWTATDTDTGETVSWPGAATHRIACGQIAETWVIGDSLGRLMAIGVITPEELAQVTADDDAAATPAP
ncbi:MAG: nuclear transport factor 2 family protein [Thermomicrobiales bacterium]